MTWSSEAKTYKILFMGNTGAGKTSLLRKAIYNTYTSKEKRSVVVEPHSAKIDNISFILYDAPG